jgi:hypothetical protein
MINKQILKFPAAMLLAGVALRVCMNGIISIWLRMGTPISSLGLFAIRLLLSVLLFLLVGRMVRRQYSKKEFIRSANLLVFYSIAVLLLEQITQYAGVYSTVSLWLMLPTEIFNVITEFLSQLIGGRIYWISSIPALFAPYLFFFFIKEEKKRNQSGQID